MKRYCLKKHKMNNAAMTLPELLVAAVLLAIVLVGILYSYITCIELNEISKRSSITMHFAQNRVETIKNAQFDQIKANYDQDTLALNDFTGMLVSYVDDSNTDLLGITVTVCWRQPNGRIIGEDLDLDGNLDAGEDTNGNGILDSIVQVKSYIYDR